MRSENRKHAPTVDKEGVKPLMFQQQKRLKIEIKFHIVLLVA